MHPKIRKRIPAHLFIGEIGNSFQDGWYSIQFRFNSIEEPPDVKDAVEASIIVNSPSLPPIEMRKVPFTVESHFPEFAPAALLRIRLPLAPNLIVTLS
jgi:hypothetical protein